MIKIDESDEEVSFDDEFDDNVTMEIIIMG